MNRYFLVGARPVALIGTPDGGLDVVAYDWQSGAIERHMEYLARVTLDGDPEVDEVTEAAWSAELERLRGKRQAAGD